MRTSDLRGCLRFWRSAATDLRSSFSAAEYQVNHDQHAAPSGLFGMPELAEGAKAYQKLTDKALTDSENLLQQAFKLRGRTKVVEKLDELSNTLCKLADMADFVRFIHPPHSKEAHDCVVRISSLVETLNTDVRLYDLLAESLSSRGSEMDPETTYVGRLLMHDFEQSGIHLERQKRERCVQLNEQLLELNHNFMNGTLMPVSLPKSNLNEKFRWMFHDCADSREMVEIRQPYGDYEDPVIRQAGYCSFFYREATQYQILNSIVLKRLELANLCGYQHYSAKVSQHSAIGDHGNVHNFLHMLNENLLPFSAQEFRKLQLLKNECEKTSVEQISSWDVQYYMDKARPTVDAAYKDYFSLGTCLQGLNQVFTETFGLSIQAEQVKDGELWHPSVRKLGVYDDSIKQLLGYIYCDFFARDSKPATDCHFTIQGGKLLNDGSYQMPIVALLCNFKAPEGKKEPVLLSISQLENLFHEMGHAMHSMVARTRYQHVTGTRCVTDFSEVPSNLLEFFTRDSRVLKRIAKHYSTDEQMPNDLLYELEFHRKFGCAADMQHQLMLASFDYQIHSDYALIEIHNTYHRVAGEFYPEVDIDLNAAFYLRFGHLIGYGAKYYSYLYCRAIATKIWQHLFQTDPFCREAGEKYKHLLLRHGGAKQPRSILQDLFGETPSLGDLSESLVTTL